MPKGLIAGTLYLVTVEAGDYHTLPIPFRLYGTRVKADRFIERIRRYHAKKPVEPGSNATDRESEEWWGALTEWQEKHPGGAHHHRDPDEWHVRPMPVC